MTIRRLSFGLMPVILGTFLLTGCPPKKKLAIEEKPKIEEKADENKDKDQKDANQLKPGDVQISQDWSDIPALGLVHFNYDAAQLDDNSRAVLKKNVAVLKKLPASVTIRVEGHCDARGTVEYNIALGQRRANAISTFYSTSGIAKSRLKTISFGEERPLCTQETDDCYAQNRRGTTKVRNDAPITVSGDSLK